MIGNNSCGAYSASYGTTREHVKSIKMLLSDGSVVVFKQLCELELNDKLKFAFFGRGYLSICHKVIKPK
mgnify:CR=1 FL=1